MVILCLPFFGCANVFEGMANKTTDEALFEDVQKLMDDESWDEAITKLNSMSSEYKARSDVIEAWAGVYAGKCGLNFLEYFKTLGDANLAGTPLFKFLMNAWTGETVSPSYCTLAQTKLEEISTSASQRTPGQNLFMAILGMVKIGVYLRSYADRDGAGNLGDGTAEINVCTNDASNLANANLDEIVTGMGLITTNLAYLTAVLSNNSISGALTTVDTACQASPGACGRTNAADVTNADRDLFRDILNTSASNPTAAVGVGACSNALVTACCP